MQAYGNLGIKKEDLELKDISEVASPGMEKGIAQLRYNHHRTVLMNLLNSVIKERKQVRIDLILKFAKKRMKGLGNEQEQERAFAQ